MKRFIAYTLISLLLPAHISGCISNKISPEKIQTNSDNREVQVLNIGVRSDETYDDTHIHSIKMRDEHWLYEKCPESAEAGELVTVKIKKAYDVGYLFLVNGEKINMDSYTDLYWEFSFTMPDSDTEIAFKTYDGFLPDHNYRVLIETFWLANQMAEEVSVREYYGEFPTGAIAAIIDSGDCTQAIWEETAAGYQFIYRDGNRITVLYNEVFCTLPEAFEKGIMTEEDISAVFELYFDKNSYLYEEST